MSQRELYEKFYAQFQASRTALTARLEAAKTIPKPDAVQELSIEVAKLRKSLVDGTYLLPAYDQRQCEDQMTVIEKLLEEIRASAAPKPRFAFKRKANAGTPTSQPSHPGQPVSNPVSGSTSSSSRPIPSQSTNLTLSGHRHKYLSFESLPPASPRTSSSDLAIADLDHCIVNLCPPASHDDAKDSTNNVSLTALQIRDIRDSILILPLVKGSVMLHNLTGCIIAVGCHQFRMHNSTNVNVYLSIQSNPVIEHCSAIRFAPYPPSLPPSPTAAPTGTDLAVQDFSHIRPTPSPNWSLLADGSRIEDWRALISASEASVDDALRCHLPSTSV